MQTLSATDMLQPAPFSGTSHGVQAVHTPVPPAEIVLLSHAVQTPSANPNPGRQAVQSGAVALSV